MTFFYDLNKKLKEVAEAPKSVHQNLNEDKAAVDEGIIGTIGHALGKGIKKAGKALAGPGDQELIADLQDRMYPGLKKAGQTAKQLARDNPSDPAGNFVKGGKKLGVFKETPRTPITKEEYGPLEEKGGAPMTAKQKKFAALAEPKDKITFADKIAGAKQEVDEMLGDVAAEAMKSALRGGQKKLDKNHNGKLDAQDFAMLRAGKGKQETDESALQAYLGKKKYGKEGMKALQKAGREGASEKTMDKIRSQHEVDEGWDDMIKDVDKRRGEMKKGEKKQGHKGEIEKTATGIKHTRRYDDKTGETDTGDDDAPKGEKRRGRPKGTGKAMGAKGPSGKSKLMTKENAGSNQAQQTVNNLAELRATAKQIQRTGQYPQGFASQLEVGLYDAINTIRSLSQGVTEELDEAEMGFSKVEKAVAKNPKVKNPAAVAASIGREKYGQKEMTRRSVAGRKDEAEELDEKAVSQQQQKFMGMVHSMQKGEKVKGASPELKKVARTMKKSDAEDFAATKHKGLPKKVKDGKAVKEEETETPKAKGGMQFGKGIYDSMNRELEQMIAESMNISMNMSDGNNGGPAKSLTVTATDEDALYLGKLLKMAGVGSGSSGGCGCGTEPCSCNAEQQVDENSPDWPTDEVVSDDALQYSGGLNKPKTTVAGDGQTTVPVTAVQVREEAEEELDEQEQVMAVEEGKACDVCDESPCKCESVEESLARFRSLAGIQEAAKPDYIDLDKDGDKKESMKKAAADAEKDKKVEESVLNLTNLWKAYKG